MNARLSTTHAIWFRTSWSSNLHNTVKLTLPVCSVCVFHRRGMSYVLSQHNSTSFSYSNLISNHNTHGFFPIQCSLSLCSPTQTLLVLFFCHTIYFKSLDKGYTDGADGVLSSIWLVVTFSFVIVRKKIVVYECPSSIRDDIFLKISFSILYATYLSPPSIFFLINTHAHTHTEWARERIQHRKFLTFWIFISD